MTFPSNFDLRKEERTDVSSCEPGGSKVSNILASEGNVTWSKKNMADGRDDLMSSCVRWGMTTCCEFRAVDIGLEFVCGSGRTPSRLSSFSGRVEMAVMI